MFRQLVQQDMAAETVCSCSLLVAITAGDLQAVPFVRHGHPEGVPVCAFPSAQAQHQLGGSAAKCARFSVRCSSLNTLIVCMRRRRAATRLHARVEPSYASSVARRYRGTPIFATATASCSTTASWIGRRLCGMFSSRGAALACRHRELSASAFALCTFGKHAPASKRAVGQRDRPMHIRVARTCFTGLAEPHTWDKAAELFFFPAS